MQNKAKGSSWPKWPHNTQNKVKSSLWQKWPKICNRQIGKNGHKICKIKQKTVCSKNSKKYAKMHIQN